MTYSKAIVKHIHTHTQAQSRKERVMLVPYMYKLEVEKSWKRDLEL